jgi:hypothetical protein
MLWTMMHTLDAHARARSKIGAHFFEALERRAFTERQVMKIYGLKDFFDQKFFISFKYVTIFCLNYLNKKMKIFYANIKN